MDSTSKPQKLLLPPMQKVSLKEEVLANHTRRQSLDSAAREAVVAKYAVDDDAAVTALSFQGATVAVVLQDDLARRPEYVRVIKEEVLAAHARIPPETFCVHSDYDWPVPALRIEGMNEPLAFPLTVASLADLKHHAQPAKFGLGSETVLDRAVRDTLEVPAAQLRCENPAFAAALTRVVATVSASFGLPRGAVTAHLHKLLVYEKGGHFDVHRDSEKTGDMFATLIVALPSLYQGGDLVVAHGADHVRVHRHNPFQGSYVAFYADCPHRLEPVVDGARVVLTYNLHVALAMLPTLTTAEAGPSAKDVHAETPLQRALASWARDAQGPPKLVFLLAHCYSARRLQPSLLKGHDRIYLERLRRSIHGLEVRIYLGHVKRTNSTYEPNDLYRSDPSVAVMSAPRPSQQVRTLQARRVPVVYKAAL